MRTVILLILVMMLMGGGCMPIVAGTAALQGVPALLNPIASSLGQGIGAVIQDFFTNLLDSGMDMEMSADGG